jgi:cobalt-zinc-cadmium efflux system protein
MSHSHHDHDSTGNIRIAFFLNISFALLEIAGGFWTNSMAILSDALHDLGDAFSLGLAWFFDNRSKKTSDHKYSFGYRRFSLLGALVNSLVLILGSLFILSRAIPRLLNPEESNAAGMALFAVVGIAVNGVAVLRVKGGKSLNERVVAWHLLEDVLGWAAVLVISIVLLFKDVKILDPLLSVVITLYVLYSVAKNFRKTISLFLQGVPEEVDITSLEADILSLDNVESVHHTHVWSLDGAHHVLTTHVVVENDTPRAEIVSLKCAIMELVENLDIEHTTIEVEYIGESCNLREKV